MTTNQQADWLLSNMDRGVLRMPFDMTMDSYLSRRQFYDRVQDLLNRIDAATAARASHEGEQHGQA